MFVQGFFSIKAGSVDAGRDGSGNGFVPCPLDGKRMKAKLLGRVPQRSGCLWQPLGKAVLDAGAASASRDRERPGKRGKGKQP